MGRQLGTTALYALTAYVIVVVCGCLALQFDSSGAVQRAMNAHLFSIPFFKKPIDLTCWKLLGTVGALMFAGRWVVQFFYARRAGRPVTPLTFWVLSLFGSNMMLIYFVYSPKQDMVGVLSNFLPSFVAAYNLYLELSHRKKLALESAHAAKRVEASPLVPLINAKEEPAAGE